MPLTSDSLVSTKLRPSHTRPKLVTRPRLAREAGSGVGSQADAPLRPGGLRQDHASEQVVRKPS